MRFSAWAAAAPLPACSATTVMFFALVFANHRSVETNHEVLQEMEQQQRWLDRYYPTLIPHGLQKKLQHQKQDTPIVVKDELMTGNGTSGVFSSYSSLNVRGGEEEAKEGREVTLKTNSMSMLDVDVTDKEITPETDEPAAGMSTSEVEEPTAKVPTSDHRPCLKILEESVIVASALTEAAHTKPNGSQESVTTSVKTALRENDGKRQTVNLAPPLSSNWPYQQEENVNALGVDLTSGSESEDSPLKTVVEDALRVNAEERRHDDDSEENSNLDSSSKGIEEQKSSEDASKATSKTSEQAGIVGWREHQRQQNEERKRISEIETYGDVVRSMTTKVFSVNNESDGSKEELMDDFVDSSSSAAADFDDLDADKREAVRRLLAGETKSSPGAPLQKESVASSTLSGRPLAFRQPRATTAFATTSESDESSSGGEAKIGKGKIDRRRRNAEEALRRRRRNPDSTGEQQGSPINYRIVQFSGNTGVVEEVEVEVKHGTSAEPGEDSGDEEADIENDEAEENDVATRSVIETTMAREDADDDEAVDEEDDKILVDSPVKPTKTTSTATTIMTMTRTIASSGPIAGSSLTTMLDELGEGKADENNRTRRVVRDVPAGRPNGGDEELHISPLNKTKGGMAYQITFGDASPTHQRPTGRIVPKRLSDERPDGDSAANDTIAATTQSVGSVAATEDEENTICVKHSCDTANRASQIVIENVPTRKRSTDEAATSGEDEEKESGASHDEAQDAEVDEEKSAPHVSVEEPIVRISQKIKRNALNASNEEEDEEEVAGAVKREKRGTVKYSRHRHHDLLLPSSLSSENNDGESGDESSRRHDTNHRRRRPCNRFGPHCSPSPFGFPPPPFWPQKWQMLVVPPSPFMTSWQRPPFGFPPFERNRPLSFGLPPPPPPPTSFEGPWSLQWQRPPFGVQSPPPPPFGILQASSPPFMPPWYQQWRRPPFEFPPPPLSSGFPPPPSSFPAPWYRQWQKSPYGIPPSPLAMPSPRLKGLSSSNDQQRQIPLHASASGKSKERFAQSHVIGNARESSGESRDHDQVMSSFMAISKKLNSAVDTLNTILHTGDKTNRAVNPTESFNPISPSGSIQRHPFVQSPTTTKQHFGGFKIDDNNVMSHREEDFMSDNRRQGYMLTEDLQPSQQQPDHREALMSPILPINGPTPSLINKEATGTLAEHQRDEKTVIVTTMRVSELSWLVPVLLLLAVILHQSLKYCNKPKK